jgi:hypothetical protein
MYTADGALTPTSSTPSSPRITNYGSEPSRIHPIDKQMTEFARYTNQATQQPTSDPHYSEHNPYQDTSQGSSVAAGVTIPHSPLGHSSHPVVATDSSAIRRSTVVTTEPISEHPERGAVLPPPPAYTLGET